MPPLLLLIISVGLICSLACLLFAAPFVPPFRSLATNVVLGLTVLGNIFVGFVIFTTVHIYQKSKNNKHTMEKKQDSSKNVKYDHDLDASVIKKNK